MPRHENETNWDERRIDYLRKLKASGYTHDEISRVMELTRGAVSGGSRRFCKDIPVKQGGKRGSKRKPANHLSRFGAENLAHSIETYWADQGYSVRCSVVKTDAKADEGDSTLIYGVKTDMINGLPRDYRVAS